MIRWRAVAHNAPLTGASLEAMNELLIRNLLQKKLPQKELIAKILNFIDDPSMSWEDKRPLFHFLYNIGQDRALAQALQACLEKKTRAAFDLLIEICARGNVQPGESVLESFFKGVKKQNAFDEILASRGWDKWDSRIQATREEWLEHKIEKNRQFKQSLIEKFEFMRAERMTEQAGRELKRLIQLYPEDEQLQEMHKSFEVDWAREVLSSHMSRLQGEALERTRTQHSTQEEEMLKCFLAEGEKLAFERRDFAFDLAVAFWFMEDYNRALEILAYAPPGLSSEWMRAEGLFEARRFVEALEQLNLLEVKYVEDPESIFAVSYLRAQCLHELGQHATALEILQSIVRVRAQYRSAHALILKWTSGASWE